MARCGFAVGTDCADDCGDRNNGQSETGHDCGCAGHFVFACAAL